MHTFDCGMRNADFGLRILRNVVCFSIRIPQSEIRNRDDVKREFQLILHLERAADG